MNKSVLKRDNEKIKQLLNKQHATYNLTLIKNDDLFNLFDFLFEDKAYLQLLKVLDKEFEFTLRTKEDIKLRLISTFEKDILSKLAYLQITFLYLRRKCIIKAESMSNKAKESLVLIKYQTKG